MKRRLACVWLADDQSVKWSAPGGGGDGGLERLAAVDWRGAKIAALMPPERVLLTAAQAPTASRKTAIAAAPFAIEEKLLEDLETAAVVVADKREASGLWSVAACSREWIADQISQLDKVGNIRPALVLPACLALPYPADGWAIADYEGRRMARLGRAHGFAAEAALADETLARFWRRQPPRIVRYYPDSQTPRWQPPTAAEGAEKEAAAAETIVDIDADANLLELFKRGLQQQPAGINLLEALPRRADSGFRRRLRPWRFAIALGAAWAAAATTAVALQNAELSRRLSGLRTQNSESFTAVFGAPGGAIYGEEMAAHILRAAAEAQTSESGDMLSILAAIESELQGATIERVSFEAGALAVTLVTGDEAVYLRLRDGLAQSPPSKLRAEISMTRRESDFRILLSIAGA